MAANQVTDSSVWHDLDRQADEENGLVVVTGSAGWAGRSLLDGIVAHTSIYQNGRLVTLGRHSSTIQVRDKTLVVHPHAAMREIEQPVTLLAPFAFLTRDRVAEFGSTAYVNENLALVSETVRIIQRLEPSRVISVSSGAAAMDGSGTIPALSAEPYGFLKNVEEWGLNRVCHDQGIGLAIGRLWGASGATMPITRQYALSDFIMQAKAGKPVHVRSSQHVHRSYVDMGQFLEVLVGLAGINSQTLLDSGGDKAEIGDVARLVADEFGVRVTRSALNDVETNALCPDPTAFTAAASGLGIKLAPLPTQVSATIRGHKNQLAGGTR
jgi:nucleoside-diphosphate-sugar epimerase